MNGNLDRACEQATVPQQQHVRLIGRFRIIIACADGCIVYVYDISAWVIILMQLFWTRLTKPFTHFVGKMKKETLRMRKVYSSVHVKGTKTGRTCHYCSSTSWYFRQNEQSCWIVDRYFKKHVAKCLIKLICLINWFQIQSTTNNAMILWLAWRNLLVWLVLFLIIRFIILNGLLLFNCLVQ